MTEQEKREKAIEEMANYIPEKINVMFSSKGYILLSKYLRKNISTALIKKGYRKEEEARKETVIKFVDTLKNTLLDNKWKAYDLTFQDLKDIAKNMFGVEVDE